MRSSTSWPWSRNHSAMRVAVNAARRRTSAGSSEVDDDDDRAGEAFGSEVVLDELAHLSAALADQREHRDRRFGAAGDHREQRRLTDAGTGEDAHALPAAARHERVERAHAERQRFACRSCGASAGAAPRGRRRHVRNVRAATGRRRSGGRDRRGRGRAARARPGSSVAPSALFGADRPTRTPRSSPSGMHTRPSWCTATTSAITAPTSPCDAHRAPIGSCSPSISRFSPTTRATRPWHVGPRGVEHVVEQEVTRLIDRAPRGRGRARR